MLVSLVFSFQPLPPVRPEQARLAAGLSPASSRTAPGPVLSSRDENLEAERLRQQSLVWTAWQVGRCDGEKKVYFAY